MRHRLLTAVDEYFTAVAVKNDPQFDLTVVFGNRALSCMTCRPSGSGIAAADRGVGQAVRQTGGNGIICARTALRALAGPSGRTVRKTPGWSFCSLRTPRLSSYTVRCPSPRHQAAQRHQKPTRTDAKSGARPVPLIVGARQNPRQHWGLAPAPIRGSRAPLNPARADGYIRANARIHFHAKFFHFPP